MKKKAGPVSGTKTAKKAPATKAASKKKVATKATKTSNRKSKRLVKDGTEVDPGKPLPPDSNDYVNVLSSKPVGGFLLITFKARANGMIRDFGFRAEDEDGGLLQIEGDPQYNEKGDEATIAFKLPPSSRRPVEVSDYTVVILTKKKLLK